MCRAKLKQYGYLAMAQGHIPGMTLSESSGVQGSQEWLTNISK
jgi:hypothetical protein